MTQFKILVTIAVVFITTVLAKPHGDQHHSGHHQHQQTSRVSRQDHTGRHHDRQISQHQIASMNSGMAATGHLNSNVEDFMLKDHLLEVTPKHLSPQKHNVQSESHLEDVVGAAMKKHSAQKKSNTKKPIVMKKRKGAKKFRTVNAKATKARVVKKPKDKKTKLTKESRGKKKMSWKKAAKKAMKMRKEEAKKDMSAAKKMLREKTRKMRKQKKVE